MGWAFCKNAEGRECGYGVQAKCDQPGCRKKIDRGLAYVCGGMHDGGDHGCGGYFCSKHRMWGKIDGDCKEFCLKCYKSYGRRMK